MNKPRESSAFLTLCTQDELSGDAPFVSPPPELCRVSAIQLQPLPKEGSHGTRRKTCNQRSGKHLAAKQNTQLQDLAGSSVTYEIERESFDGDVQSIECLEYNGPQQVANAFRVICDDELGKEAIQEAIKKVVFQHVADPEERAVECADGVLSIRGTYSQSTSGTVRDRQIQECIEAAL
jgi:hypothetical protein